MEKCNFIFGAILTFALQPVAMAGPTVPKPVGGSNPPVNVCIESGPEDCRDGLDNDCNGNIDCRDAACSNLSACISTSFTLAAIGDFGGTATGQGAVVSKVVALVKSWNPDHILDLGDDNYQTGEYATLDQNIGQYFCEEMGEGYKPATTDFCPGTPENSEIRFWPTIGNHSYKCAGCSGTGNPFPYLYYFDYLPGNKRFYEKKLLPDVRLFVLNSEYPSDPTSPPNIQKDWFNSVAPVATEKWKIVMAHGSPWASHYGPFPAMEFNFLQAGVDLYLAGHNHGMDHLLVQGGVNSGLNVVVNGSSAGGLYSFSPGNPNFSIWHNDTHHGATKIVIKNDVMEVEYWGFVSPSDPPTMLHSFQVH